MTDYLQISKLNWYKTEEEEEKNGTSKSTKAIDGNKIIKNIKNFHTK